MDEFLSKEITYVITSGCNRSGTTNSAGHSPNTGDSTSPTTSVPLACSPSNTVGISSESLSSVFSPNTPLLSQASPIGSKPASPAEPKRRLVSYT